MYTQCPTCQTLFRIRADQLRAANGRAHCCRCDQVFNALEHLRESPAPAAAPEFRRPEPPAGEATDPHAGSETPDQDKPLEQLLEELEQEWQEPEPLRFDLPELDLGRIDFQGLGRDWSGSPGVDGELPGAGRVEAAEAGEGDAGELYQPELDLPPIDSPNRAETEPSEDTAPPGQQSASAKEIPASDDATALEQPGDYPGETEQGDYLEPASDPLATAESMADDDPAGFEQLGDYPGETEQGDYLEPASDPLATAESMADDATASPAASDTPDRIDPATAFNLDPEVPPLAAAESEHPEEPLSLAELLQQQERPPRRHTTLWVILILMALALALAQTAWLGRERLLAYEEGRWLLQSACRHLGCQLPTRRDPEQFEVVSRSLVVLPDAPGVLQVTLEFRNQAPFAQPLPAIQLQLFGNTPTPLARRTFTPAQYAPELPPGALIASGQIQHIELQLQDPGPQVSGFRFDFR